MGLDMYALRIKKLTDSEIKNIKKTKKIPDKFISFLADKSNENELKDLVPFATKVSVNTEYIDMKKIKSDNGISENAYIGGEGYHGETISYTFIDPDTRDYKKVDLTRDDILKNYIITEPEERFVVNGEPIGYWRKEYKLQDKLYDLYPGTIDNLGYHKCTPEMIDAMKGYAYDDEPYVGLNDKINDDDIIFYHEWY